MMFLAESQPITVEQLLTIIGALLIPAVGTSVWLVSMLYRLEGEIKGLREIKEVEEKQLVYRIEALEKGIHSLRNTVTALSLAFAKEGHRFEKDNP